MLSASVSITFLASNTLIGAVVVLLIEALLRINLTVPLSVVLTIIFPSVTFPDITYVPALVIVTVEPIWLPSVICEADESSHDDTLSSSSNSIDKSESALEASSSSDTMLWLSVVVLLLWVLEQPVNTAPINIAAIVAYNNLFFTIWVISFVVYAIIIMANSGLNM